jgi:hypothetical protein
MKMVTHVIFGAGSIVVLLPGFPADVRFLLAASLSPLVNSRPTTVVAKEIIQDDGGEKEDSGEIASGVDPVSV